MTAVCVVCRFHPVAPGERNVLTTRCLGCRPLKVSRGIADWSRYDRCDECGVDAQAPCIEDDDVTHTRHACRGRALRCLCGRPGKGAGECGRRRCRGG